ncbi:MAG TPA: lytic transglycosylase domain-containing protein [Ramlibacter sp.]|nr:lytic transglycosylase domain-containing protein [Ramlibacter sp.]
MALALLAPVAARADVWGFVDERGVAHFAAEKVDDRYELFFRGGQSFDTAEGLPLETPRAANLPTTPSRLVAYFEFSPSYKQVRHHLKEASQAHGIDIELLQALIATESGFDPQAVSPKGAVGLMQVMPATAERWGVSGDARAPVARKLTDPRTNVRTGSRYLAYLMKLFPGQLDLALAAYNAGEGAVQRAGNRIPNYRETQNYVKTVLQIYASLKPPTMTTAQQAGGPGPRRVRMELPGLPQTAATAVLGGAARRGNMPPPLAPSAPNVPLASLPTPNDNYTD